MSKRTKEPVKHSSSWWCDSCKTDKMEHSAMMTHLKEAHRLETKGLKCNKNMVMHLDYADSYSSTYEVTIETDKGELKLTNATCNPRHAHDPMRDLP